MPKHTWQWVLGAIALAVVLGLLVWGRAGGSVGEKTTREVAESCTTDMATQFHIHPHLVIMTNGVAEVMPANIGITNGCMHPLHTHDTSGVVHVESPVKRDFTLGDFFFVWGRPFDQEHLTRMTVNGVEVATGEATILRDKDEIVLTYEGVVN